MAREREDTKGKSGNASLELEDAVDVGLFDAGPATVKESVFADYDYGGNAKAVPVWLVTYERDGEAYEQPYSLGKGWKVVDGGKGIRSKTGQPGLARSCNAIKYLLDPLRKAGMPKGAFGSDPTVLEGMECVLDRVPQEKRKGLQSGSDDKERSILIVEEIVSAPWDKGGSRRRATAPASTSTAKGKAKPADDDDDEDDEKPAKGKGKPAAEADTDLDEEAVEALIEALDQGPLKVDDIAAAVRKATKGNPQSKAIAARCEEDDFLEQEKGWTFNAKKGAVELD